MPPKAKKPRLSKLARENDLSTEEEVEIKEAFHLFSTKLDDDEDNDGEFAKEKEGVIRTPDVRRALIALGLAPSDKEELTSVLSAVDPTQSGYTTYPAFLSVAALKLHSRTADSVTADVEHAYRMFTRGSDGPIQLSHLRRVARELKEDVDEELLKNMIREANGGEGLSAGVSVEQFRDVMTRAGVF